MTPFSRPTPNKLDAKRLAYAALTTTLIAASLGACSSKDSLVENDKAQYKAKAKQNTALDVPPDLTQLQKDGKVNTGVVSAAALAQQQSTKTASTATTSAGTRSGVAAPATVAVNTVDIASIERAGNQRWIKTTLQPEEVWPQLRSFWQEQGLALAKDTPNIGIMETDWAENRAKLPSSGLRSLLGSFGTFADGMFSTGQKDMYRSRLERTATGTEVYITHRGLVEVYTSDRKDTTTWQASPANPELEAEMLSRFMVKLGGRDDMPKTATASAAGASAPATPGSTAVAVSTSTATSLTIEETFDRSWRRVGIGLEHAGFTVEDRDRSRGTYYVRYVDPASVGKEYPGMFAKMFKKDTPDAIAQRYQVLVKAEGKTTTISVQDSKGVAETGDAAKRIIALLTTELK